jgi:membrane protein
MARPTLKGIWRVILDTVKAFGENKITKLSGSLAYYTVFSMAPLLIMIISISGMMLGTEAAEGQVYGQLSGFVGEDTAAQLQEIIRNASLSGKSVLATVIGGVTLLVGATTVFAEIQDSINSIWGIKAQPRRGWVKLLINRVLSFSVIVSLGFLLLVSLAVSAVIDALNTQLKSWFPDVAVVIFYCVNLLITFFITTIIFGVIFKVLPDATIRWRDVWAGAMATAFLFMLGKSAISIYIAQANIGSTYGAAGSLAILLVWVYYSSIILYFGAAFTKHYALKYGQEIRPRHYAVATKTVTVDEGSKAIKE